MRVLFGVHALPSATYGGTELYTKHLAEELATRDHEVAVATPRGTDADIEGGPVFELPESTAQPTDGVALASTTGVTDPNVESRFCTHLASFSPDIVHLQHLKGLSAGIPRRCSERDIPCLLTLHDFWSLCHREQLSQPDGSLCCGPTSLGKCTTCYAEGIQSVVSPTDRSDVVASDQPGFEAVVMAAVGRRTDRLRAALRAATRLISPSMFLRSVFREHGIPAEQIIHLRNGVTTDRFDDTGFDSNTPLRIGYVGRITPNKGVHLLIDAFDAVGAAELHVFGVFDPQNNAYHSSLREQCDEGRTTYHGWYEDPRGPFAAIDVLVLPSIWHENSPFVIQEAFASGVPVVTADRGGMAELVTSGVDSLTFPIGDHTALAERLRRLAADPSLVARLREGIDEPTRLSDHAEALVSLYRTLTARGARRTD